MMTKSGLWAIANHAGNRPEHQLHALIGGEVADIEDQDISGAALQTATDRQAPLCIGFAAGRGQVAYWIDPVMAGKRSGQRHQWRPRDDRVRVPNDPSLDRPVQPHGQVPEPAPSMGCDVRMFIEDQFTLDHRPQEQADDAGLFHTVDGVVSLT